MEYTPSSWSTGGPNSPQSLGLIVLVILQVLLALFLQHTLQGFRSLGRDIIVLVPGKLFQNLAVEGVVLGQDAPDHGIVRPGQLFGKSISG